MKKAVSLKDIANNVGVSTALVSYVLNGKEKEARVSKQMAAKIRRAAKEMNYQPNLIARSLKYGKTKTIGLIVADISNPFFSSIARIIENKAKENGYTVVFGSSDEQLDKSADLLNALINRQVDGLIVTPVENSEEQIREIQEKGIPVVLIDRYFPKLNTNAVFINNYQSAYNATQHLIDNGYKKIGMVAYQSSLEHMKQRVKGYEKCLKDNGINASKDWLLKINYNHTETDFRDSLNAMLENNTIDSLLFATVSLADKSLHVINSRKIKIPDDFGLISFDESDAFDFFYSPLTFIKQNLQQLGSQSVQLLIDSINNNTTVIKKIEVPSTLVVRDSSKKK